MTFDATSIQSGKQPVGEVKTGGRGGNGSFPLGVDRLIICPVLRILTALGRDLGRQRDMTDAMNGGNKIGPGKVKHEQDLARVLFLGHSGIEHAR